MLEEGSGLPSSVYSLYKVSLKNNFLFWVSFQYVIGSYCPPLYANYANISHLQWRVVPLLAMTMSFLCQFNLIHEHLRDRSRTGLLFPGVSNSTPKQLSLPCTCLGREVVMPLSKSDVSTPSTVKGLQAAVAIRHSAALCSWCLPTTNSYLAGICLTVEGLPQHMLGTSGHRKLERWRCFQSSCPQQAQWLLN